MVCDSTNVFVDGRAGSEADVRVAHDQALVEARFAGKVAVACFASNVARMDTAIRAAEACGRRVCLVGRSMHRMAAAAKSVGLFQDIKAFISDERGQRTCPTTAVLYLCTGSQGEPNARPSRASPRATHPHVRAEQGRPLRLLLAGHPRAMRSPSATSRTSSPTGGCASTPSAIIRASTSPATPAATS